MNLNDLANLGEFIGGVAVVATLVYLAVQIRQNTQSVRSSAETAMSHHVAAWSSEVVHNPDLGRIWDVAAADPDSLTDDEKRVYLWYVAQIFYLYEGQFHLFADGHIRARSWSSKAKFLVMLLKLPLVDAWWGSRLAPLSDDFVNYIDRLRLSGDEFPEHKGVIQDALNSRPSIRTESDV